MPNQNWGAILRWAIDSYYKFCVPCPTSHITNSLWLTCIRYRSQGPVTDRGLTDVDQSVFVTWTVSCVLVTSSWKANRGCRIMLRYRTSNDCFHDKDQMTLKIRSRSPASTCTWDPVSLRIPCPLPKQQKALEQGTSDWQPPDRDPVPRSGQFPQLTFTGSWYDEGVGWICGRCHAEIIAIYQVRTGISKVTKSYHHNGNPHICRWGPRYTDVRKVLWEWP